MNPGTARTWITVLQLSGMVSFLFLLALGILWGLKRLVGGSLHGTVFGTVKGRRARIVVRAAGLVGGYLAIVAAEFSAVYLVARILGR